MKLKVNKVLHQVKLNVTNQYNWVLIIAGILNDERLKCLLARYTFKDSGTYEYFALDYLKHLSFNVIEHFYHK